MTSKGEIYEMNINQIYTSHQRPKSHFSCYKYNLT